MKPKPELLNYGRELFEYENWKRDTLVWCAETMAEAADTMERCMFDRPTPAQTERSIFRRWYARALIGTRLRYWAERSQS